MVIPWLSTRVSAIVDSIPFVMAVIPVIREVTQILGIDSIPLYWALSLDACLGGNATPVDASANIVVMGIVKKYGYHVSFRVFAKYVIPVTLLTVGLAAIYLIVRYAL